MIRPLIKAFALLLGLLAAYCWWVEPCRLSLTQQDVTDPEQPLQTPIRVLLVTDFHSGRFSRPAVLRAKMERLRQVHQAKPFDLILLGGDYIDTQWEYLPLLTPCLETLKQFGVPLYAVLGNHDYTTFQGNAQPVIACLQSAGVCVLRNDAEVVTVRSQRLLVVGLDDLQESAAYYDPHFYQTPKHYQEAAGTLNWYCRFDDLEPETPRLLLSHNPDAVYLPGRKPRAVLCGHTHGGQIMLLDWIGRPLHRWLHVHLPPGSAVTWAGRRTVNDRQLIVSRGIEGSSVPIRLFRPPQAVIVTLH